MQQQASLQVHLRRRQQRKFGALMLAVRASPFYRRKLASVAEPESIRRLSDLPLLPFTTKEELLADQQAHPPYGTNLTQARGAYTRLHQTSGSSGRPLRWLDTAESWQWVLNCWRSIYDVVGLNEDDRLFFPFSFGPFLGFWAAFEGAARRGHFCLPGGGMTSRARLQAIADHGITVVACTPTYGLRLAEVAKEESFDLAGWGVRALIVAGEPGGSIPATRRRLESAWGAHVFDHMGMTEIGPSGIECPKAPGGVHVLESEYLAEIIDPATLEPVAPGQPGELVLTNLGRLGNPLVRYRTGDLVTAATEPCPCGRPWLRLEGGIVGRIDEMLLIRGNNVYPSALEAILLEIDEIADFRIEAEGAAPETRLKLCVEPAVAADGDRLAEAVRSRVQDRMFFRPEVIVVPPGTLPRFELKARRVIRHDGGPPAEPAPTDGR